MIASYDRPMSFGSIGRYEVLEFAAGHFRGHLAGFEALLDGVLMRAGERGEHEVARVRVALRDLDLIAVLHRAADRGHV